jgi:VanZ family protein
MRRLTQIAAWLLLIAISWLSLCPPSLRPVTPAPHNIEHIAIFLLMGFAFRIGYPRQYLFQSIALIGFAGLIEIAQLWVPGRHARLSDFIVDASAVCAGIGLAWLIDRFESDTISGHDHGA